VTDPLQEVADDAVLLQQVEQFTGHDGAESDNPPALDHNPLVVRAGMTNQRVGRHIAGCDCAEQLHFLAPHDIRAVVTNV